MGLQFIFVVFLSFLVAVTGRKVGGETIVVQTSALVAKTDSNFVCATIDWWPHDKNSYNYYPWGYTSAINMNLSNPFLARAVQAFGHLRIRIGGSLQDQVVYDVGPLKAPCRQFGKVKGGLFDYSKGCLHMPRWDELNGFFKKTGAIVTFGLNALYGRHNTRGNVWEGDWDYTNAQSLINYTISRGYQIDSWEFGNELCGSGIGASVGAEQYAKDLINLRLIIDKLYMNSTLVPSLIAPGGFYDEGWFAKLLQVSGSDVVNVMSHHIYNLGAGVDPDLVKKILDPHYLSGISTTFKSLRRNIQANGPWSSAWVGESGGAYNSGGRLVSNTFVNSFWYLDQLGMSSKYNTKVYCRQTLVGGHYGLLNKTSFVPNPDYYSALLWHRLMGEGVLAVNSSASPFLRSYAHCSKQRAGITLLLINLSNVTQFTIDLQSSVDSTTTTHEEAAKTLPRGDSLANRLKKMVSWVGSKASGDDQLFREEYHLTPKDGYLQSQTMLLNEVPLELTDNGEIPRLNPVRINDDSPISVDPLSIAFVVLPKFIAPACA